MPARPAPLERGYPVVGVLPRLLRDPEGFCAAVAAKHGDVVRLNLGFFDGYMISHPDHIKHVFQDRSQAYGKGKAWEAMRTAIGNSLPVADGAFWLRQRRIMQPAFHRQRLACLTGLMVDVIRPWLDQFRRHADSGEPLDLYLATKRLTRDVVIRAMFSTALTPEETAELDVAVPTMMNGVGVLMWTASWPAFLPAPGKRRVLEAMRTVDRIVRRVIQERRVSDRGEVDLLSMLLAVEDEETREGMKDQQLRDEVLGMFVAGYEATSISLAWTWYALMRHPEIAQLVAKEARDVLGNADPTFESAARLTTTRATFQEAMRFYPPGWVIPRQALEDDSIGGYTIPKGAFILVCHTLTHRRRDCWRNPDTFDPAHFAQDQAADRSRFAYLPFGAGPRQCIGNNFALLEAQLILAMTMREFVLELADPVRRKAVHVMFHPSPSLRVRVRSGARDEAGVVSVRTAS